MLILLRVIIARDPISGVVTGHGKLRVLFLHNEIIELLLLRELITQAHALVINAEADNDVTVHGSLVQGHRHLVIVVTDGLCLTPHRCPGLVKGRGLLVFHGETVHEVLLVLAVACVLVFGKLETKVRRFHNSLLLVAHLIGGSSVLKPELHTNIAVRRGYGLRSSTKGHKESKRR